MQREPLFAVAFSALALGLGGVAIRQGLLFVAAWPVVSLLLVAAAYALGTAAVFGKRADGSRARWAQAALFPYLCFARCVWELQTRLSFEPPWHVVHERWVIARRLRLRELPPDVSAILDLTCELTDPRALREHQGYRCRPLLDANTMPATELRELVHSLGLPGEGRLLVHCANGHGRTGLVAAAWLYCQGIDSTPRAALERIRRQRPLVRLRRNQRATLADLVKLPATRQPA